MKLHVIGTGSKGNCYVLETETEALIIEAGMKVSAVKEKLNFNIQKIKSVLVSHEHL